MTSVVMAATALVLSAAMPDGVRDRMELITAAFEEIETLKLRIAGAPTPPLVVVGALGCAAPLETVDELTVLGEEEVMDPTDMCLKSSSKQYRFRTLGLLFRRKVETKIAYIGIT